MTRRTGAQLRAELNARKDPEWLVEGLIGRSPAVLFAEPFTGKTHLAVNAVAAILDGRAEFLGRKANGPASCAYVALDSGGDAEVLRRLEDLTPRAGDVLLYDALDWNELERDVRDGVRFVVVDNLFEAAGADDLFAHGTIAPLKAGLERLIGAGASLLVIHHPSKGGVTPSGTAAITAYFRQSIRMRKTTLDIVSNHAKPCAIDLKWSEAGPHGLRIEATGERDRTTASSSEASGLATARSRRVDMQARRRKVIVDAGATTSAEAARALVSAGEHTTANAAQKWLNGKPDLWTAVA